MFRELFKRAEAPLELSDKCLEVRVHRRDPPAKFKYVKRPDASLDLTYITLSALQPSGDLDLGQLRRLTTLAQKAY